MRILHIEESPSFWFSDMLTYPALPVVEALIFTAGCALIQAHRDHAERLTGVLAAVALVGLLSLIYSITPIEQLNAEATAMAVGDVGEMLPEIRK